MRHHFQKLKRWESGGNHDYTVHWYYQYIPQGWCQKYHHIRTSDYLPCIGPPYGFIYQWRSWIKMGLVEWQWLKWIFILFAGSVIYGGFGIGIKWILEFGTFQRGMNGKLPGLIMTPAPTNILDNTCKEVATPRILGVHKNHVRWNWWSHVIDVVIVWTGSRLGTVKPQPILGK